MAPDDFLVNCAKKVALVEWQRACRPKTPYHQPPRCRARMSRYQSRVHRSGAQVPLNRHYRSAPDRFQKQMRRGSQQIDHQGFWKHVNALGTIGALRIDFADNLSCEASCSQLNKLYEKRRPVLHGHDTPQFSDNFFSAFLQPGNRLCPRPNRLAGYPRGRLKHISHH